MKQKLLLIAGPTAVGKSDFALELSKHLKMEIISADSVQVYKDLNVGTSKPTTEEKNICPHHLIDIRNFDEKFNAFDFTELAKKAIKEISSKGKLPVVVGGTGLYMEALLFSFDFENKRKKDESCFDYELFVLNKERQKLYDIINKRTEKMIQNGLLDEVKNLKAKGATKELQSMQAIGYKQMFSVLEGELSLEDAVLKMKQDTRNYAKRQLTWFRHMQAKWVDVDTQKTQAFNEILKKFAEYKKMSEL